MDLEQEYLTKQIIAYIGNKRKLLSLIYRALESTGLEIKAGLKFFDVFAGSGVVSRFAKSLNFEVYSNDWEYYSYIINSAYIGINKKELAELFGSEENFSNLLDKINTLPLPAETEQYVAKYYAPKELDYKKADYKTERLFYTRQNALAIDKIRNYIEETYPPGNITPDDLKRRNILLANLLYEAATHNNTSGVFKACHKEFGGHGKDALKRILGRIELNELVLIDSDFPAHIFQEDANNLVKKMPQVDIAYLDPPYNQHQYGSNYHMLNTIAKWDHIPVGFETKEDGSLKEKAGIRHDWIDTRSNYCYKEPAVSAFEDLIENLNARFILISYSTDGIIPFEELQRICLKKGKVSIITNEYTTYRGGKKSNERQNSNIEFVLCIDTNAASSKEDVLELDSIFVKRKSSLLFKQNYFEEKLKKESACFADSSFIFKLNDRKIEIHTDDFFSLKEPEDLNSLTEDEFNLLQEKLERCACKTKEDELSEILRRIKSSPLEKNVKSRFRKMLPQVLKNLAHKKNRTAFYRWLNEIRALETTDETKAFYSAVKEKIDEAEAVAFKRFNS